jgi:hypothetical protein
MTKNIAVLVPSYNSRDAIELPLRAILAQAESLAKHVDFVMLSDDGSSDDTVAVAERLWTNAGVPLVVRRAATNKGEYTNVNSAIAAMPAHIEWVLIMHADNEPLPCWIDTLARECARVDTSVASISGSWESVTDGVTTHAGDPRGPDFVEDVRGTRDAVRNTLLRGCWWHNGACAVRVSAWRAVGGHPENTPLPGAAELLGLRNAAAKRKVRVKGDWDTLLRMLSAGYTIRYVATPLIRYVENTVGVSGGSFGWHGDLIETVQIARWHQAALSLGDIGRIYWTTMNSLIRRFGGAALHGEVRRAGYAVRAIPVIATTFGLSLADALRGRSGRRDRIPFAY